MLVVSGCLNCCVSELAQLCDIYVHAGNGTPEERVPGEDEYEQLEEDEVEQGDNDVQELDEDEQELEEDKSFADGDGDDNDGQ